MISMPDVLDRPNKFVCKCVRLRDGFPEFIPYIGYWNGWKEIGEDVSVYSWRAA